MRERQEITEMFEQADRYILKNPEILAKSIDDIFEDLDDGSPEMIHTRWGVMVRAKMANLTDFDNASVIRFLSTIEEKNLMCEYIGYVLQEEKSVCLLKVVVASRELGVELDFLPFITSNVEHEKDIEIDDVPIIIDILEKNKESNYFQSVLRAIGQLIVKEHKEEAILEKYMKEPTESMKDLICFVGVEVCRERSDKCEIIIECLLKQDNRLCNLNAIDIWGRCILNKLDCVDNFLERMISLYDKGEEYRLNLIPHFVEYLEVLLDGKYRASVFATLQTISGSKEKTVMARAVEYKRSLCNECRCLVDWLLEKSFEKNETILNCLDLYLEDVANQSVEDVLICLKKIYKVNEYNLNDEFFEKIPNVCKKLAEEQETVCKTVVDYILCGESYEFAFAIRMYEHVMSIQGFEAYIKEYEVTEEEIIIILKGILFFSIDSKKLCKMIYVGLKHVDVTQSYMDFCTEMIYGNYPGTFIEISKQYLKAENEKQRFFAEKVINFNNEQRENKEVGYKNEELQPSEMRRRSYYREMREQEEKINQEAHKKSVFSQLFSSRKMKYGKRHAFVQIVRKGKFVYQVQDYVTHSVEYELPKVFVSDPIEFMKQKNQYLEGRCINETDC